MNEDAFLEGEGLLKFGTTSTCIERTLNKLLEDQPPTKDNLGAWTFLHRNIQSTLNLLEKKLEKTANDTV